MDLNEALKALAKETKKPYALLKKNHDAGDQLVVGRVNDLLGIKATRHKTTNATSCEIPGSAKSEHEPISPAITKTDAQEPANATSCEKKKSKAGRPQFGAKPLTSAERMKLSRDRKRFPADGREHSGKMLSTMLSGEAHSALNDLLNKFSHLLQKEIIEQAIIYYSKHTQGE